jgi:hypothetical protein
MVNLTPNMSYLLDLGQCSSGVLPVTVEGTSGPFGI